MPAATRKLTEDDVREIRDRWQRGEGLIPLSIRYKVSDGMISMIVHRQRWKHVR